MQVSRRRHYYNLTQERVTVTIYSAPCESKSMDAQRALTEIFMNIINDPRLIQCDDVLFDSCRIGHDGTRWVLNMEAMVPRREFNV